MYQIKVSDASDSTTYEISEDFEFYVNALTFTIPTAASSWDIGTSFAITWEFTGYVTQVNLELYQGGIFDRTIAISYTICKNR